MFIQLLQRCENSRIAYKFRFKSPLYSLDASHIDLSLSLCEWAKVYESKASIKLTVGLNHSNTLPEFVALGDGIENDRVQGRVLKFPARSIVVFDKVYIDDQWFVEMSNRKVSFVTGLRRIAFYDAEKKRTFEFLSNHFHLAASTIAAIYKDRWKVELFLKPSNKT